MSDLDDDLLALAGGAEESEVESDSGYQPTLKLDDDDDDEALSNKRKLDDSDTGTTEELINPYPLEGKYKDAADRDELESMDEIRREQILFDRTQEMERFKEKKYLLQRMKQQNNVHRDDDDDSEEEHTATRTSKRSKGNRSSKVDKLSELRKQREKKSKRQFDDYEDEDEDEDDDQEEEADLEEDDYQENQWGGHSTSSSRPKRSTERAKVDDVNKIRLGRTMLTKYCFYSEFTDIVVDCYARVNLGVDKRTRQPLYRMVKIIDVVSHPSRAYRLGSSKCDIFLLVSQNRKQTKEFPISIFSDSVITPDEFGRYLIELEKTNETVDFVDDVTDKSKHVQSFINKGVTDKDVNEMIARKKKLKANPSAPVALAGYDAVFQKSRLLDELKVARQQPNNQAKITDLIKRIKDLDALLVNKVSTHNDAQTLNTMGKVNERNRKLNNTNIRKAEIKTKQNILNGTTITDGGDPFSRLKTVTRMFYQDLINQEENEKALKDAQLNYEQMLEERTKQEAKIASSTYRVLGEMDKLINSIDFDIVV